MTRAVIVAEQAEVGGIDEGVGRSPLLCQFRLCAGLFFGRFGFCVVPFLRWSDFQQRMNSARDTNMPQEAHAKRGKVYIVGAGPGAPGLITLRGVECLGRADVVLYDNLVNPRVLRHAPEDAERICLWDPSSSQVWTQENVNTIMVELARAGRTVVRLKADDPDLFVREESEVETLVAHDIPYETVPGITAALAASSYAGVPLTGSEGGSAVALVTSRQTNGQAVPECDYAKLAQFPGPLAVYVAGKASQGWVDELIAGGISPDTPAWIIQRCSLPTQSTMSSRVGDLKEHLADVEPGGAPVIVVIVRGTAPPPTVTWFEQLPLFGQTILVTRPAGQAATLASQLEELGAEAWIHPAIEVGEPADWAPADRAISRIDCFHWLVFSSVNGVRAFVNRLLAHGRDLRALSTARIAAIGPATVAALERHFLRADVVPERYQAEYLAEALVDDAAGKRYLLVRASRGRDLLARQLEAAGADVEQVVFYESADVLEAEPQVVSALAEGKINWTTVTSSAIARSLARLFGKALSKTRLASISPVTSDTLRELGYEPTVEAPEATMDGLLQAIRSYCTRQNE